MERRLETYGKKISIRLDMVKYVSVLEFIVCPASLDENELEDFEMFAEFLQDNVARHLVVQRTPWTAINMMYAFLQRREGRTKVSLVVGDIIKILPELGTDLITRYVVQDFLDSNYKLYLTGVEQMFSASSSSQSNSETSIWRNLVGEL